MEEMTKKCEWCYSPFITRNKSQLYCRNPCNPHSWEVDARNQIPTYQKMATVLWNRRGLKFLQGATLNAKLFELPHLLKKAANPLRYIQKKPSGKFIVQIVSKCRGVTSREYGGTFATLAAAKIKRDELVEEVFA